MPVNALSHLLIRNYVREPAVKPHAREGLHSASLLRNPENTCVRELFQVCSGDWAREPGSLKPKVSKITGKHVCRLCERSYYALFRTQRFGRFDVKLVKAIASL